MPPSPKKVIADGAATVRQVTQAEAPKSKAAQAAAAFDLFDAPPISAPSLEPVVAAAVNEQTPPQPKYPSSPRFDLSREDSYDLIPYAQAKYLQDLESGAATAPETPPVQAKQQTRAEFQRQQERPFLRDRAGQAYGIGKDGVNTVRGPGEYFPLGETQNIFPDVRDAFDQERYKAYEEIYDLVNNKQNRLITARESLRRPQPKTEKVQPDPLESATAIVEQVMQGTPLNEVVVAHGDYMPMDLMDDRPPDSRPPTSTVQVSSYLDPSTTQGQRAAEVAAQSQGMGAAGAGMGSGGGSPPRPPTTFADQPDPEKQPIPPPLPRSRAVLQRDQAPRESLAPPILPQELEQRARIAGNGLLSNFKSGWKAQAGPGDRQNYADSVVGDTFRGRQFPELEGAGPLEQAAFLAGRVSGDVTGYGTRKLFWNLNPEDALGTATREAATWAGLNGRQAQLARYTGATALGLASANYNPFNIGEGGRSVGFSAVNPNEDDPRKTDNPVGELLFDRMMLGRTGRLLPWEQFHEERPDVSYEKYAKYQDYIRGPSALGMFKATADGIDGPEARMMGYRVQPEAVAAALAAGAGVIAAFKYGGKGR